MNASPSPIRDLSVLDAPASVRSTRSESNLASRFPDELREAAESRRPESSERSRSDRSRSETEPPQPPTKPVPSNAAAPDPGKVAEQPDGPATGEEDPQQEAANAAVEESDDAAGEVSNADQGVAVAAPLPVTDVVQLSTGAEAHQDSAVDQAPGSALPTDPATPKADLTSEESGVAAADPSVEPPVQNSAESQESGGATTQPNAGGSLVAVGVGSESASTPDATPDAETGSQAKAPAEGGAKPIQSTRSSGQRQRSSDDSEPDPLQPAPTQESAQAPNPLEASVAPVVGLEEAAPDDASPPAPTAAESKPAANGALATHDASASPRSGSQVHRESAPAVDGGPRVNPEWFLARVSRAFQAAEQNGGSVQLRLSPPELGSLQIRIAVHEGALTASLEAETPAARNLLLDNLPALRERLAQQDIRIERFDVDVRRDPSGGQQDQPSGDGRRLPPPHRSGAPASTETPSASGPASVAPRYQAGRLNVVA